MCSTLIIWILGLLQFQPVVYIGAAITYIAALYAYLYTVIIDTENIAQILGSSSGIITAILISLPGLQLVSNVSTDMSGSIVFTNACMYSQYTYKRHIYTDTHAQTCSHARMHAHTRTHILLQM